MKIAASTMHLQAQHLSSRVHSQSTRLEMWVGQRPRGAQVANPDPSRPPPPRISEHARHAAAAARPTDAAHAPHSDEGLTPHLAMVRDLLERMTGMAMRVFTNDRLQPPTAPAALQAPASSANTGNSQAAPRSAGFGLDYEHHELLEETEHTQFSATGVVRTQDGQEIRFTLQLDMQRSYREESWTRLRLGDAAVPVDPLVINFDGTAAQLQDLRFAFDLDGNGQDEQVPLLAGNRGYLALDRNQNQRIDNGLELYGPATGNGYAELASHDDDGNGWIDENDAVYSQLRVWTPAAEGAGNLSTLQEAGVGALALATAATPFGLRTADNRTLGAVQATSIYLRDDGSAGSTQQIDLAV